MTMQPPGAAAAGALSTTATTRLIRGHLAAVPGSDAERTAEAKRRREEAALAASHSRITQSLADHAERVAKKARTGDAAALPSPASRLAAMRERLAARVASAAGATACTSSTTAVASTRAGLEDLATSTAVGAADAGVGGNSDVGQPADRLHAATYAAQHGVARGSVGGHRRLSD